MAILHGVLLFRKSLILFSLILVPFTTALTLPPLSNHTASTAPQLTTNSTLTALSEPIRHCVADPTWSKSHHNIAPDCEAAVDALEADRYTYGSSPGVFTYHARRSWVNFPNIHKTISLPKRYPSGQCVVAIVMVKAFETAGILFPELPPGKRYSYVDTMRWGDLVEPASYVRATCGNGVGYAVVGREGGVAVLILETGSRWDRYVLGMEGGGGAASA